MMKNIWKKEKSTARGEELGNVKMNEPVNSKVYTRVKTELAVRNRKLRKLLRRKDQVA